LGGHLKSKKKHFVKAISTVVAITVLMSSMLTSCSFVPRPPDGQSIIEHLNASYPDREFTILSLDEQIRQSIFMIIWTTHYSAVVIDDNGIAFRVRHLTKRWEYRENSYHTYESEKERHRISNTFDIFFQIYPDSPRYTASLSIEPAGGSLSGYVFLHESDVERWPEITQWVEQSVIYTYRAEGSSQYGYSVNVKIVSTDYDEFLLCIASSLEAPRSEIQRSFIDASGEFVFLNYQPLYTN